MLGELLQPYLVRTICTLFFPTPGARLASRDKGYFPSFFPSQTVKEVTDQALKPYQPDAESHTLL